MIFFLSLTTFVFAAIAAYFAFLFERKVKESKEEKKEITRKVFELGLLSEITEKVGYSLNIESVAKTIALTAENLFDLSTVSYAIKGKNGSLIVKTFRKENVGITYAQTISGIIRAAITALDSKFSNIPIIEEQEQNDIESNTDNYFDAYPMSYFNIPLIIDNSVVGMINISSRKKGVYQDNDMTLLYRLVNIAQTTISRLHGVIETEKGKLNSMILTLPSGAILFGFEHGNFSLSVINQAARNFLGIKDISPDISEVVAKFGKDFEVVKLIKDVINEKKSMILDDVKIADKSFKIFVSPAYIFSTGNIVGVSIIMRDKTSEERIDKIRSNFMNMIVHDLRAPAAAIKGASSLILSSEMNKEDEGKMMKVIVESSNNMLSRISNILDLGRVEAGTIEISKTKANFKDFTKAHIDVFSYAARERNIEVKLTAEENLPEFYFDTERIGQVINNLVSNSLKYTNEGGRIEVKFWRQEGQITVKIVDNGLGIPESKKPFLFTKFGRIRQTLGAGESTGLGLFIAKEIVEAHGGKIWVESPVKDEYGHEHKGTAVYFTIPFEEEKASGSRIAEYAN